jgi:hypothetical protein
MADDIKIIIGVDATPVERAVRVMDNLEAEVRKVERAEKAGLITKERAKAETDRLTASMQKLKTVANGSVSDFNKFEKSLYGSGKAARRNEVAFQQAGYQFQDFIVQVQGGTNPLIAFSQQGSQLAGFFAGPWGAAIGLGIAAVGALGTAIMGTMGQIKSFEDQLKETTTSLEAYFDLIGEHKESFGDTFDLATKNLVKISEAYKDLLAIAKIEAFDGINKLNDSLTKSVLSASYLKTEIQDVGDLINEGFVAKVSAGLGGKAGTEIRGMYNALVQLREAPTLDAQYQAALKVREIFKQNVDVTGELTDQQKQFWRELSTTIQKMELLGAATNLANEKPFDQNELDIMINGINTYLDAYVAGQKGAYDEAVRIAAKAKAEKEAMTKDEIDVMTNSINTYLDAYVAGQKGAYDEAVRIAAKAKAEKEAMTENEIDVMTNSINTYLDAHEAGLSALVKNQKELNDAAGELGTRLGISFATALSIIRQAKVEAMVGLDAFGGGGDYRYDLPQTITPDKPEKARGGGGKSPAEALEEYLKKAEQEVELKRKQVGLTEAQARAIELETKFLEAKVPLDKTRIKALVAEEEALRKATEAENRRTSMIQSFESTIENALMSMVDGSQSVENAFKGMLRNILLEIYKQQVAKPAAEGIGNLLRKGAMAIFGGGQTTPSAYGNIFQNGSVKAFANGGVVNGATFFPMTNGTGLMGEAGPEAIMPLKRGPNGRLGVEASGGQQVVVNQSFNFAANGDESVKKIIAQAAPQIAQMTQKQIMDSRRRGGQMKAAFS